MKARGKWLTIEGSEGVGKSTQIKAMAQYLSDNDIPYIKTREPGGTQVAEQLREILISAQEPLHSKTEVLILYAARCQHLNRVILPALEQGRWVLCDRFNDSSFAYQGGGRGLNLDEIGWVDDWILEGASPDATLILDIAPEIGLERIQSKDKDRIESERAVFFERVREVYHQRAKANPERYELIDAGGTVDEVKEKVLRWMSGILA